MAIKITNISGERLKLETFAALQPGETIETDYRTALKYVKSDKLGFDFSGGTLPFKEDGRVKWLTMLTVLNPSSGYGIVGTNAVTGLMKRGVEVCMAVTPTRGQVAALKSHRPEVLPAVTHAPFISEVGLCHSIPSEFSLVRSPRKVGWTMWEATRIPRNWIEPIRRCERLIVPSTGQVPLFEEVGVPITVIPDGMGVENFSYVERDPDPEVFTFVSWARMSSRKCPFETIECFQRAFPGNDKVRLIMKTVDGQFGSGMLGIPNVPDPRVTIINENWPVSRLVDLCHQAHCAVFLSHGEGFYNPPTQAMASGLPVILPNHSGCVDQCNPKYNYPVGLDPVNPFESSPLGQSFGNNESLEWWVMDYDAVVETMRHVYHNREEAFAKGKLASKWVRKKFSIDVMVDGLLNLLNAM